jgi:hypothetical protein
MGASSHIAHHLSQCRCVSFDVQAFKQTSAIPGAVYGRASSTAANTTAAAAAAAAAAADAS